MKNLINFIFGIMVIFSFGFKNQEGRSLPIETRGSNTAEIPFFALSGMILVRAVADGQEGYFILDTGAPGLILNRCYFIKGASNSPANPEIFVGLNGKVRDVLKREVSLQLGVHEWKNVYASLYDLEYLEQAKGVSILGLLGSLLFRKYELEIDFEKSKLIISTLNKQGDKIDALAFDRPPEVVIPFREKGHLPYIETLVDGLPLNLGIDSGAAITVIAEEKFPLLSSFLEPGEQILVRGLSQQVVQAMSYRLQNLTIANLSYTSLRIAFADLQYVNDYFAGLDLDGIVGLELLSQHRLAINFKKKEVHIWVHQSDNDLLVLKGNKRIFLENAE